MSTNKEKNSVNRKLNSSSSIQATNVNNSNKSVISNSDQIEGEPCTHNTNTTYNDTLSAMSEKVPVEDSSLAGNKNSPLNQDLLFSIQFQQKPNKNEESVLNHQISRINPNRDNSEKEIQQFNCICNLF
ncbi:hypothetical protein TNIN_423801 [Trichonephila inaurata madagascariensis]|uniref:Uncharacterized protein n=1 Tax=Trichonephila inaurata madagascariensis TaxID=2747483 RepID=A0A8X6YCE7_9ARAC|nr:hypothetical protein TNIN_423801 [Trichonephila inaurata madagascariensis]